MAQFHFDHESASKPWFRIVTSGIGKYWFQIIVFAFTVHFFHSRDIKLSVAEPVNSHVTFAAQPVEALSRGLAGNEPEGKHTAGPGIRLLSEDQPAVIPGKWKESDFNNLSFILNPDLARRKNVGDEIVRIKLEKCRDYVKRFAKTAVTEMEKYGIPASIKLAQGLLETDAGASKLAGESNNHFGIKCRKKCRGCTCRNYSDDDPYDMFRVFDSAWDSYREHSLLLQTDRYKELKLLGTRDYKGWATGLKQAGYATDKHYHKKLIRIIDALDLDQFDHNTRSEEVWEN